MTTDIFQMSKPQYIPMVITTICSNGQKHSPMLFSSIFGIFKFVLTTSNTTGVTCLTGSTYGFWSNWNHIRFLCYVCVCSVFIVMFFYIWLWSCCLSSSLFLFFAMGLSLSFRLYFSRRLGIYFTWSIPIYIWHFHCKISLGCSSVFMIDSHCIEHQRQTVFKSGLSTKRHYATKHAENNKIKLRKKGKKMCYFVPCFSPRIALPSTGYCPKIFAPYYFTLWNLVMNQCFIY